MEVSYLRWRNTATENITKYLNRGGPCKGDEPQYLYGTRLLNTIGMAMGLPVRDPSDWTEDELKKALNNNLVYFSGEAREAIDVIAHQIKYCCGNYGNYVTVLPIELYFDGKLYELPLFRVKRFRNSQNYYVDNIGRIYDSFDDWFNNSKLPPCAMAYPCNLKLSQKPGFDYASVHIISTPSDRTTAQTAQKVDQLSAITGISSGIASIFVTGGLAIPFILAGVTSAVWGTIRSGQYLVDRSTHGQTVNPFTNSESRMLWLGIAANIISFGNMGASTQLARWAIRGEEISNAFQVFVNITNGTYITVSGLALLNTTMFLCNHHEDLSARDVLMHVASIAFWTKGLFTYKTAGTIIREVETFAITHSTQGLSQEEAFEFNEFRNTLKNDAQLLREFHRAADQQISTKTFAQILLDAQNYGPLRFDNEGNIILPGGQTYSFKFLSSISHSDRMHYFDIITNLSPEKVKLFESFRQRINNDMKLITGLANMANHYQITPLEASEQVIHFWKTSDIKMNEAGLVVGRAPPIALVQLKQLSLPMVQFIGEHLSMVDTGSNSQWTSSVPVLLSLQGHGMFTVCPVTRIVQSGRACILLNSQLNISIFTLHAIPSNDCKKIFELISRLKSTTPSSKLPADLVKLCVQKYRLRFEIQRTEIVNWMARCSMGHDLLSKIVRSDLQNFEKDMLYMFYGTVKKEKAEIYMTNMMKFVAEMNPRDVGDMVAYGEFVVACVTNKKELIKQQLKARTLSLPPNEEKAKWVVTEASKATFERPLALRQKLNDVLQIVRDNQMVGEKVVSRGLSDEDLVAAIRAMVVKFVGEIPAAYHIIKHPVNPLGKYITVANDTIRSPSACYTVILTQDGDGRNVKFQVGKSSCIVLEKDGRVSLSTFMPE